MPPRAMPLCLALLLAPAVLRAADAALPPEQNFPGGDLRPFTVGVVSPAARYETSAAILLLQASSGNPVYAVTTNPFPLLSPHWSDRVVNPDFAPAFAVGVRRLFDSGTDVRLGWTHLNSSTGATTVSADPLPEQPAGMPPMGGRPSNQAVGPPYLIGPPLPFAVAHGVLHAEYDAVDLDAGITLGAGSVLIRPFAGVQYAHLGVRTTTDFASATGVFRFTDVASSAFDGVGPRIGMDLKYACGGFDFLGGIAGSTLAGRRRSSLDFLTASPQGAAAGLPLNAQAITSQSTTQVVPGLDARLGAGYSFPVGRFGVLRCEAGYQAAVYVNAVSQYSLSEVEDQLTTQNNAGTEATFLRTAVEVQRNFLVHGPYAKLFFQF